MDFPDFFELLATVLNWIKTILGALGLIDTEQGSNVVNNIDNALEYLDTEPNTST